MLVSGVQFSIMVCLVLLHLYLFYLVGMSMCFIWLVCPRTFALVFVSSGECYYSSMSLPKLPESYEGNS